MKIFDFIKNKIKLNNEPKKRLLIKQLSLLCVVLFMLVTIVWAWFYNGEKAEADGLSVIMGTGDTMLISLDGGESFVSGINLLNPDYLQYIGESNRLLYEDGTLKLSMQDITSDGMTFYRPKFNEINGQRIPNTSENWDYANKNTAYISQDIIFRTTKPSDIFMNSGTQIITSCENEGKELVSDSVDRIGNKSTSGNFSKDCIVGALRISAIDTSVKDNPMRFLCIPRSDIELVRNGAEISMLTGDALTGNSAIHVYYDSSYQTTGSTSEEWDTITGFEEPQYITTTQKTTDKDGNTVYQASATVNLWLEGCDPEVTRILSGGKYMVNFDFLAIEETN